MQKKLIALAVAGLVAAPAFAQSNVTIYGRADYGMVTRSGTPDGFGSADLNGKTEFASGVQAGSRLGFKGAEDLGNGLKAIFEIEYGLKMDEGTTSSTVWGNRHSYVGLTGNFGTVVGGRLVVSVDDGSVHRLRTDGSGWEPIGRASPRIVHRLVADDDRVLILGGARAGANLDLVESLPVGR